jgi:hypothetical protein
MDYYWKWGFRDGKKYHSSRYLVLRSMSPEMRASPQK